MGAIECSSGGWAGVGAGLIEGAPREIRVVVDCFVTGADEDRGGILELEDEAIEGGLSWDVRGACTEFTTGGFELLITGTVGEGSGGAVL